MKNATATSTRTAAALGAAAVLGTGLIGLAPAANATQNAVPIVTNLRTGSHSGYDRVVVDFRSKAAAAKPGVKVRFAKKAFECGSGRKVSLPGDRILILTLTPAQAHTDEGANTYVGPGRSRTAKIGLPTLKGVRMICDFEGYVQWAFGVNKATGAKFGTLSSPNRVFVDIAR